MNFSKTRLSGLFASASIIAAMAAPAHAQPAAAQPASSEAIGLEEIIVTAQKRQERLQEVPLAVTAVGAGQIAARGLTNIVEITRLAPNVNFNEGIVNPTLITPFIRGIGTIDNSPESDMPVAVSIDGVYLASVYGGLIDAFDIQQVEILRGPQGTLQGRNAPGGAINISTRRPGEAWVGRAMFEYGRFDDFKLNVGVDGPLVPETVGLKLAFMRRLSDGFQKNTTTGERFGGRDSLAFKAGIELTPTEALDVWLTADYTKDESPPTAFRDVNDGINHPRPENPDQLNTFACLVFGRCTPSPKYHTGQVKFGDNKITNWGLAANVNLDAGPATFTSVTGYRKIKDILFLDIDATPFPLLESRPTLVRQKTFSQEFRVASNDGGSLSFNDHVRWLIGGYYMHSKLSRDQELFAFGNSIGFDYAQKLKSYALFGHVDILATDRLTIGLGARESWDKKDFTNFTLDLDAKASWKKFMYDANVNYKITPDQMIYARYARGSRPGGFNQSTETYDPETVDSYEAGVKTSWLDRKLTFNLAGFYYKYKGIQRQTSVFSDDGTNFVRLTTNAGASHAYGVELEVAAQPVTDLNITLGVGYLDAKYDKWEDSEVIGGVRVPVDNSTLAVFNAPKWTINAGISYGIPMGEDFKITPSANVYHKSSHHTATESNPVDFEDGHTLLSAALRLEGGTDGKYALTVFGDNLLDQYYIQNGGSLGGLGLYVQEGRPRTYGVRLEVEFR